MIRFWFLCHSWQNIFWLKSLKIQNFQSLLSGLVLRLRFKNSLLLRFGKLKSHKHFIWKSAFLSTRDKYSWRKIKMTPRCPTMPRAWIRYAEVYVGFAWCNFLFPCSVKGIFDWIVQIGHNLLRKYNGHCDAKNRNYSNFLRRNHSLHQKTHLVWTSLKLRSHILHSKLLRFRKQKI